VGWFFGRELRRALKVPVGLINSSVGGTPAEAWTARAALEGDPELRQILEQHAQQERITPLLPPRSKRRCKVQAGGCPGESGRQGTTRGAARPG
jgi:hypothetical protein